MGADGHAAIEVSDVVIHQSKTAGRNCVADSLRRVGAMDAINGVSQMHRARAERITRAPGHKAGQIRLARNLQQASPGEAVAADPDAVY
jgi:hypothetical protein